VLGGWLASPVVEEMVAEEDYGTSIWQIDGSTASISRMAGQKDAGILSSSRFEGGMMARPGGVALPFVGVGEVGVVGKVVAGCGMERGQSLQRPEEMQERTLIIRSRRPFGRIASKNSVSHGLPFTFTRTVYLEIIVKGNKGVGVVAWLNMGGSGTSCSTEQRRIVDVDVAQNWQTRKK
jgi:hypothetical protein